MGITLSSTGLRRQVISEACEWFIEFRTADATASTRDRFDEWLRHSPEHIQAYLEVAAAWAELPTQDTTARIDVEALVARARASSDEGVVVPIATRGVPSDLSGGPPGARGARRFAPSRALAAVIAAVAIVAGTLGWLSWSAGETYTTDVGEQRTVRLADDSIVDLNARSSIRVHFSSSGRIIDLVRGQALFHVARDPQRPFIVRSDATTVRAVGTQFDVYRKDIGLVVTVVEGRVAVVPQLAAAESAASPSDSDAGAGSLAMGHEPTRKMQRAARTSSVLLSAGEQLTVTPTTAVPTPHRADVGVATAWAQRRLIFDDTPLAEVAAEFNRYSTRRLIVDDPELAGKTLSGVYSSSDPDSLIGFLRAQPSLEVLETDREIRVMRRAAVGSSDPE
jgi:transmembrane sensor